jgi:hypothetical protein
MAARSYLSRIAQPLTAADPLLWSVPQPASEEARPSIEATPTAALRRSPATASPTSKPAKAAPAPPTPTSTADAAPADGFLAPSKTHLPASEDRNEAVRPLITPTEWPQMDDAAPAPTALAPTAPAPGLRPGPLSFKAADDTPPSVAQGAPIPAPAADARAVDRRENLVEAPWPDRREMAHPSSDRGPMGPPAPRAEGPRLHIGAIEVRASAPPAPITQPQGPPARAAAPAAASARIGRAYAWRFGLVQG